MKKLLCLIAALCLVPGLLGGAALAADDAAGEYTCFAYEIQGFLADPEEVGVSSSVTLDEGGLVILNGQEVPLESWALADGVLTLTRDGGLSLEAEYRDGVIVLDVFGDGTEFLYYAREDTDVSGYGLMTVEEIEAAIIAQYDPLMYAVCEQLAEMERLHLTYDMHSDYMDSLMSYDVHIADDTYYSGETTYVRDLSSTDVTFIGGGKVYNLYPDKMTGIYVTNMISGVDVRLMDDVFSLLLTCGQRTDFTEEEAELETGTDEETGEPVTEAFTAVIYPATEYEPEYTFYFDGDGRIAYILEGEPVIDVGVDIGESFYMIFSIDDAVDEALFDISGYEITE